MEGNRRVAHQVPARLTAREGRRFGLTVGVAFLVFAAISRWRDHDVAPMVLATLGGLLVLAGLTLPSRLGPVFRGWMAFGLLISKVTTPLFMGLLYFVAITPMGLLMRLFGRQPLKAAEKEGSFWARHEPSPGGSMSRQF
jgi:hypothetical protein